MFGSFGAGFGAFGSGTGGLLPTITNLTSWIRGATDDGKTAPNSKGTDANLTGVNCIDSDNDDADNIDAQLTSSPTGDWYFEATIYPQSFVFYQELASINASNIFLRFRSTTGRLGARIANSSYETSSSNAIPLNEWSRVVSQRVGSNVIISAYELDGTERFSETISASSTAFANDELVFLGSSSGRHFNGLVSDIKVGNSSTDLLCHYPLAEGSGTKAYDVSGNGNHGTITGTSWSTQDNIPSWNHEYGFDVDGSVKVPALNARTTQVATFDGVNDKLVASGISSSSVITHDGTATLTAGTNEITATAGTAYNIKVDGVLTYSMSQGIGTTTINSENSAVGYAVATNVTLASFWGTRIPDTSGLIVRADYADGNTSISNPSGYTHNGSECGFDMVTNDFTSTQLFAIDNSTATQTFVRKNNGFITQVLDYSSALTGDELTRTRKYVGS